MSKYTTTLRWIVDYYCQDIDPPPTTLNEKLEIALPKIFDFDFPIYEEAHRTELERKIVLHYFNKEICMETVALWKIYLEEALNLIMPPYNELYKTLAWKYEPLTDVAIKEVMQKQEISEANKQHESELEGSETGNYENVLSRDRSGSTDTTMNGISSEDISGTGKETNATNGTSDKTSQSNDTSRSTLHETSTGSSSDELHSDITTHNESETYGNEKQTTDSYRELTTSATSDSETTATGNKTTSGEQLNSDYPQAKLSRTDWASTGSQSEGTESTRNTENKTTSTRGNENESADSQTNITKSDSGTSNGTQQRDDSSTSNAETERNVSENGTVNRDGNEHSEYEENLTKNLENESHSTGSSHSSTLVKDTSKESEIGVGDTSKHNTATNIGTEVSHGKVDTGYTIERTGLTGNRSYISLIREYRDAILNIDRMIVEELYDLFMLIY